MDSTKERIIETALTLIAERGLSEVTMVDISRTAGIARQTLYNHYSDIPSIIADAATAHNEVAINQLDQALTVVDTPTDTIRQLIRHIASISTHPGHTLDAHHGLPAELRERLSGFDQALAQHIGRALTEGVDQGEFRADLNIETDTALIGHLLRGISTLVASAPTNAARIVKDATRTTLAALQGADHL